MDKVYQYMNQEKIKLYDEKTLKKNIGTRKTYYIWEEGGEGVSQIHEKKIVSVGLFSTFRHPLGWACSFPLLVDGDAFQMSSGM